MKMRISDVVVVIVCEGGEARVWLEVTRPCPPDRNDIPVMAAVAVRKKVVSFGHFSPSFCL